MTEQEIKKYLKESLSEILLEDDYNIIFNLMQQEIKQFASEIRISADEKTPLELMRVFVYATNIKQLLRERGIE